MSPARFLRPSRRGAALAALCLVALPLGACGGIAAGTEEAEARPAPAPASPAAPAVSSDLVPAPAVFEATGTARWDGRRTLQGVWVAHPQASTARRVRIYNAATGAAADGALFTREPVLSGPSMLVSSDAAGLLGLAPGEEAEIRVVAVTPRAAGAGEVLAAAPAAAPAAAGAAAAPATATRAPAAGAIGPGPGAAGTATAAGAPVRSEEGTSVRAPPDAARPVEPAASQAPAAEPGGVAGATLPPAEPVASAPAIGRAPPPPPAVIQPEVEEGSGTEPGAPAREPAPPAVAAADAPGAGLPEGDVAPLEDPMANAVPGIAAGALAQPYVQAGLFAVEGNADRLIRRIRDEGLPAVGKSVRLATGPATRVLAGPFATAAERDAARRRIQAMGLRDAIPVAR